MEIHQLRYVVAVARTGNFSRAAEHCHVSQPSLSQQILKLEEELGQRLFDRLKRRAHVTAAGEAFLARAVRILDEIDAAHRDAQDACDLAHGQLTIGVLPTIAPYLIPKAVAGFNAEFPGIEVILQEDTTAHLLVQTANCEVDVAIVSDPINDDRFEQRELFVEELFLAVPTNHRLATKRTILVVDLEQEKFLMMKEGHCLGDQVLRFCDRLDFHPIISCRSAQMETIQSLVRTGLGVALVPAMCVAAGGGEGLVYRSMKKPKPERRILAIWPRQRTPGRAADEFLKWLVKPRVRPPRAAR